MPWPKTGATNAHLRLADKGCTIKGLVVRNSWYQECLDLSAIITWIIESWRHFKSWKSILVIWNNYIFGFFPGYWLETTENSLPPPSNYLLKIIKYINFCHLLIFFSIFLSFFHNLTRMTTSISSKVFCSITDRQTDKIFTEYMLLKLCY